jgi:carotenoid 1,2-hydratase
VSDDGRHSLVIIAFIGSVFSPYYAHARRRAGHAGADPGDHCALNVALYDRRGRSRWCMTERGRGRVDRDAQHLRIGPSGLRWEGDSLVIDIDEITVPWPSRLRGTVRLQARPRFDHPVTLAHGHRWHPLAPAARVEVDLGGKRWSGPGYLDANHGDGPLEHTFRRWDWSRTRLPGGDSIVCYDVDRVSAAALNVGLRFGADGLVTAIDAPPTHSMRATLWRVPREARSDAGTSPTVQQTLTDAPFYARSLLDAHCLGERVTVMHESLCLRRFANPLVQAMLPFRMPRRAD